jgi:nicotinate-nucleotide pyrophosphorylase (carboxylating)
VRYLSRIKRQRRAVWGKPRYNRIVNKLLVDRIVERALLEDLGHGDITTELLPNTDQRVTAGFLFKESGVLCGATVAARCFTMLDSTAEIEFGTKDGEEVAAGTRAGLVSGAATAVLGAERVALNFLQRLSGIATYARSLARRSAPYGIRIVETRKTTPGLRVLEKYAVRIGGGWNHRMDLDHAVMLKDNHFILAGLEPAEVVSTVKSRTSHTMKVIAEAGNPGMIEPLVKAGADVVLLDNFTPQQVSAAVAQIAGRCQIELSGGINAANLDDYLIEGVDVISIGALTHSYRALDISLEL